jgi:hypothetical protein
METILQTGEEMKTGALSKDLVYLSNKRVAMSAPGIKMDDIYYSSMNSSVELSECTFNNGRLQISLSSTQYGSQSQVIIPNQSLLGQTYLHLVAQPIPPSSGNAGINTLNICRGWGWAMIQSITFLFVSSNVSQLVIPKHSILQTVMQECATAEQRSEIFSLGGQEYLGVNGGSNGAIITADLLLPFPWSSMCEMVKKPFDTTLINNPITIQVQFENASAAYSWSGTGTPPTQFIEATLYFRQGDLSNKDQSLKYELMKNPSLMYSYPFIHHQPYQVQFPGSNVSGSPARLNLLSFINADLVAITFGCVENLYNTGGTSFQISPFNYDPVSNIRLLFNGLVMYNSPGQIYKLYNMNSQPGASYFYNSVISPYNSPKPSNALNTYIIEIDFSRIRALCFENNFQNVWRIGNNTLTLELNTTTNNVYTFYGTYHYNAIAECQSGETRIYFD